MTQRLVNNGNNKTRIAVIGQGLMGLTSAAKLLERGYDVTVFSREPFENTTSMSAGAYWWPHRTYPGERVREWARETYNEYSLARKDPESGVRFEKHIRFCIDSDESEYVLQYVDEWERIDGADYGFACREAFLVTLPVIEVPVFMSSLKRRVEEGNAQLVTGEIRSPAEMFPEFELVVNCTGVGARTFAGDEEVFPIRGQIVRVTRPAGLEHSTRIYRKGDPFTLILPHTNEVILGGTAQENDWDRNIRISDSKAIVERCAKVVPAIRQADFLGAAVGLRPGRHAVRLEMEVNDGGEPVLHNYGHGGGGYTVAWGCATEVAKMVDEYFA